jgi:cyclopropane fatty-acyl-phospholipid synthase-like methyltransferase
MSSNKKPYAEACEQNAPHILKVLKQYLPKQGELLEIGSGTGQHAVIFAKAFPQLIWWTSDKTDMHQGIQMWLDEADCHNLREPMAFDVLNDPCPQQQFDAIYSANTAHIMSVAAVEAMFSKVATMLKPNAPFLIYGPFMYNGEHTSESNQRFDHWIRSGESQRGIRDVVWLQEMADSLGLVLEQDIAMPVNNRTLVWRNQHS